MYSSRAEETSKKLKKTQSDQQVMEQLDREIFIGVNCTKKKTLFSMSIVKDKLWEKTEYITIEERERGHYGHRQSLVTKVFTV